MIDSIKINRNPIIAFNIHISTNILTDASSQSGPFILIEQLFDSALTEVNTVLFIAELKNIMYDIVFLSVVPSIYSIYAFLV